MRETKLDLEHRKWSYELDCKPVLDTLGITPNIPPRTMLEAASLFDVLNQAAKLHQRRISLVPSAKPTTLREQVGDALAEAEDAVGSLRLVFDRQVDAVVALFAERERLLREQIEALPVRSYAPTLDASQLWLERNDVLAVFDA